MREGSGNTYHVRVEGELNYTHHNYIVVCLETILGAIDKINALWP